MFITTQLNLCNSSAGSFPGLAYKRNVGQPYLTYNSLLYFNLTFLNCRGCPIFLYNSFRE